jgi:catalase
MCVDGNGGSSPNYFPNSFDQIKPDESYGNVPPEEETNISGWFDRNATGENDHYSQPGIFYRQVLSDYDHLYRLYILLYVILPPVKLFLC